MFLEKYGNEFFYGIRESFVVLDLWVYVYFFILLWFYSNRLVCFLDIFGFFFKWLIELFYLLE